MRNLFSGITYKLFFTILLTCIVVALAMGTAVRYSFETGFDSYIQKREEQRLDDLIEALASEYTEAGGWHGQSSKRWSQLLRFTNHTSKKLHAVMRLTLVDDNGKYIAGFRHFENGTKTPIEINNKTIGWVYSSSRLPKAVNDEIDRQFQDRQLFATWLIVALSLALATLVSLLLARLLVVPVKRIGAATKKLAMGNYDVEVDVSSSDELGELAANFNLLANSLKRNRQLRHDLMAEISHELRTPLAVLRSEIEAMQDGLRPLDSTTIGSLLQEIKQLNHLIDDLYDLTLADSGSLNYKFSPQNMSQIVAKQVAINQQRFARAGIDLVPQLEPDIFTLLDEQRFTQLLDNLLANSLRYTDAPGNVIVNLLKHNNKAILEISDSAPGVAKELQAKIFDRFYRVEQSRNRASGGAGLGLSIVQQIVVAHKGEAYASSSELGGLLVKIAIPLYEKGKA